jgi:phosphatidylserine/phosphatidylglycerophosphate/cardiolipin synthase-like enzyme
LSAVRRSLRSRQRRNQSIPKSAEIGATRYSKTSNAFPFRAYGLTTGSGIVEALVRAKERGVDVRLIATTLCERESGIEPLAVAGVPIWIDAQARIATMVIDSAVTLTGSMNWTAVNSEDLNLISSPAVAAAYAGHWRDRLAVSSPFNRREDWCRVGSAT